MTLEYTKNTESEPYTNYFSVSERVRFGPILVNSCFCSNSLKNDTSGFGFYKCNNWLAKEYDNMSYSNNIVNVKNIMCLCVCSEPYEQCPTS